MVDDARSNLPDPDQALVRQAQQGDFDAFEQLVNRYEKRAYGLALRIVGQASDAEDVTQATLLKVLENIQDFQGRSSFASWILRIATNEALLLLRKRRRQKTSSLDLTDSDSLPHPDFIARWKQQPEELASNAEVRGLIADALEQLAEKYRLVFLLRDVQGLSTEQAAEALGISVSNAKVRLMRARLLLRERLTRILGDPSSAVRHEH